MKKIIDRWSPPFLRELTKRVEASPLGSRLARGAFWSLAGSFISRGLGLLAAILVGRMLGKDDYGALGIIQNTIGMFGTLAGFGMGFTANKHVAEFKLDRSRTSRPDHRSRQRPGVADQWSDGGGSLRGRALACCAHAGRAAPGRIAPPRRVVVAARWDQRRPNRRAFRLRKFRAIARINLISGLLSFPLMLIGAWRWGLAGVVWALIIVQLLNCLLCYQAVRIETERFRIPIRLKHTAEDRRLFWTFSMPAVLTGS